MECINDNMQKYHNYKEQMERLKKALNNNFYLEAIFIEYAVIEDRLESILRHAAKEWKDKNDRPFSITKKIRSVKELTGNKKSIEHRYFSDELLDGVIIWKEKRNKLIHALLKQDLHTEDLESCAIEGQLLVKKLCSKSTSYKRMLDKMEVKNNG